MTAQDSLVALACTSTTRQPSVWPSPGLSIVGACGGSRGGLTAPARAKGGLAVGSPPVGWLRSTVGVARMWGLHLVDQTPHPTVRSEGTRSPHRRSSLSRSPQRRRPPGRRRSSLSRSPQRRHPLGHRRSSLSRSPQRRHPPGHRRSSLSRSPPRRHPLAHRRSSLSRSPQRRHPLGPPPIKPVEITATKAPSPPPIEPVEITATKAPARATADRACRDHRSRRRDPPSSREPDRPLRFHTPDAGTPLSTTGFRHPSDCRWSVAGWVPR